MSIVPILPTYAAQIEKTLNFGTVPIGVKFAQLPSVAVLPNGNFVVTDPYFSSSSTIVYTGAVYLFRFDGTLINSFTGDKSYDFVGFGGITVLKNGNFVIASPVWHNQATDFTDTSGIAQGLGAVTWVNGDTGLAGPISSTNSLVGVLPGDLIGGYLIPNLTNHSFGSYEPAGTRRRGM